MNRMRLAIVTAALFSAPFINTGCEDTATKEALKTCNANLENMQKSAIEQDSSLKDLRRQLAEAQGKLGQVTQENEELKAAKANADVKKPDAKHKKSKSRTKGKRK